MISLATMLHVGLTGNIASGKSYVSGVFSELGAHIIDADQIVHDQLRSGTKTYNAVVAVFGEKILNQDREVDRKELARIVFFDSGKRLRLNSLVHPAVGAEILRRIYNLEQNSSNGIIIVDAALMIETRSYEMYHRLIVVACDPEIQVSRLMRRDGMTEEEARARIASQMPTNEKVKFANYVIETSGSLKQTREQAGVIYRDLVRISHQLA